MENSNDIQEFLKKLIGVDNLDVMPDPQKLFLNY
jgi:hypothetical protein